MNSAKHLTRVAVVEDEDLVRHLMVRLVDSIPSMEVSHSLGSAGSALEQVLPASTDVLLTDIDLGDGNGVSVAATLQARDPRLRVMLLSSHHLLALARGANPPGSQPWSYLSKRSSMRPDHLLRALNATANGTPVIDPALAHSSTPRDGSVLAQLTASQLAVLRKVAAGSSNRAIADELGITQKAVEYHLTSIYRTLGIGTDGVNPRVAAVLTFIEQSSSF